MRKISLLIVWVLIVGCQTMPSSTASRARVEAATQSWIAALNSCTVDRILALYDPEAVLWPTTSPKIANSSQSIREYFQRVCSSPTPPKGSLTEQNVRVYGDTAINSGTYTFTVMREGKPASVPARFSFTYRHVHGQWLILDHHSSLMPAPPR
jgi:uncharacterized protein (TIGR02246 family)